MLLLILWFIYAFEKSDGHFCTENIGYSVIILLEMGPEVQPTLIQYEKCG